MVGFFVEMWIYSWFTAVDVDVFACGIKSVVTGGSNSFDPLYR